MHDRRIYIWRAAYVAAVREVDPSKEFGRFILEKMPFLPWCSFCVYAIDREAKHDDEDVKHRCH